ncbi:MAG: hypothetical protein MRY57_01295 [Candidatus Pacebacteria bacterium]|nr:hypothetical protein [Candidatus Paceibacterota bacterium]
MEEEANNNNIDAQTDLIHEMESLQEEVHKQNSRGRIFINGIISGLGRTIGATIIFALLITIISYIVTTSDAQWLESMLEWLGLSEYINN